MLSVPWFSCCFASLWSSYESGAVHKAKTPRRNALWHPFRWRPAQQPLVIHRVEPALHIKSRLHKKSEVCTKRLPSESSIRVEFNLNAPIRAEGIGLSYCGERFALAEPEPLMSVIAAMWEGDSSILLAADSALTEPAYAVRSRYPVKLRKHETAPIAWGVAGNPTLGYRFSEWLKQYHWPPDDEFSFEDDCATGFAQVCGKQRAVIKLSGAKPEPDDFADVLIAAWLKRPILFQVNERGVIYAVEREMEFHALGSGGLHAKVAYSVIKTATVQGSLAAKLHLVLSHASTIAIGCSPPVHVWRVQRDGIDVLSDESSSDKLNSCQAAG